MRAIWALLATLLFATPAAGAAAPTAQVVRRIAALEILDLRLDVAQARECLEETPDVDAGKRLRVVAGERVAGFEVGMPLGAVGYFYVVAAAALALQLVLNTLVGSLWGKTLVAVKDSEQAAEAVGIDVLRFKVLAFVISRRRHGQAGGEHTTPRADDALPTVPRVRPRRAALG